MSRMILTLVAVGLISVPASSTNADENPLFQANEPLSVVLEFPVKDLLRQARKRPTVPGLLRYTDADAAEVVLDVALMTRGNSRLEQCSYPPLKLDLKQKQVASTIFAGQNKLKLVTQCRKSAVYLRYLNHEYITYRIYSLLTEYSFRVRMLEVTFRDSTGQRQDEVHPSFLIESHGETAARLDMTPIDAKTVDTSQLDPELLSIFTLFQYMIGNTDWSVLKGPGTEACCHNGKVIAPPGSDTGWVVLPYDFDQSGLIDAKYALPSESLPIKSVRHRLYRGFCSSNTLLESTIELFNEKRSAIAKLFVSGPNGSSENKAALEYLRSFFETVNDPKKMQKVLVDHCRGAKA